MNKLAVFIALFASVFLLTSCEINEVNESTSQNRVSVEPENDGTIDDEETDEETRAQLRTEKEDSVSSGGNSNTSKSDNNDETK